MVVDLNHLVVGSEKKFQYLSILLSSKFKDNEESKKLNEFFQYIEFKHHFWNISIILHYIII